MAEKKSIYEEAMLDVKRIQEALNANTKEMLRSVAREEIDGMVKESLEESDYEEETIEDKDSDGSEEETTTDTETSTDDDSEVPTSDEPEVDGGEETGAEIEPDTEVGPDDDQDTSMDADAFGGGDDELDMTSASDDDVVAIFKKLSGSDEVEVVGDEIHMNITEPGEYIIKTGGEGSPEMGGSDMDSEMGAEMGGSDMAPEMGGEEDEWDEDLTYEIAMDDESIAEAVTESEKMMDIEAPTPKEGPWEEATVTETEEEEESVTESEKMMDVSNVKNPKEGPWEEATVSETETEEETVAETDEAEEETVAEAIPVGVGQAHRLPGKVDIGQPRGAGAKAVKESDMQKKYNVLLSEAARLKTENEEFKKSIKEFRNMLVEAVVMNSNAMYAVKVFMEHATTKEEKLQILKRFDSEVSNLKESKKLYKTIVSELTQRKPINEAFENKITKGITTSSSKQLNEATAYVDPSTQRIKDLIKRVENR